MQCIAKGSQGRNQGAGTGTEAMEDQCLLAFSYGLPSILLFETGPLAFVWDLMTQLYCLASELQAWCLTVSASPAPWLPVAASMSGIKFRSPRWQGKFFIDWVIFSVHIEKSQQTNKQASNTTKIQITNRKHFGENYEHQGQGAKIRQRTKERNFSSFVSQSDQLRSHNVSDKKGRQKEWCRIVVAAGDQCPSV